MIKAKVVAGKLVLNDYVLSVEPIENGHAIVITRGNEVQRFDVANGAGVSSWNDLSDKPELFSGSWNDLSDKPFCVENALEVIHELEELNGDATAGETYVYMLSNNFSFFEDGSCIVTFDDEQYECYNSSGYIGNLSLRDSGPDTGEPFCITGATLFATVGGAHTIKVEKFVENVISLDEKFIPNTIARTSEIPESFSGSWNDLEDKPFGDVVVLEEYVPETAAYPEDWEDSYSYELGNYPKLVNGVTYVVTVNNTPYEFTCMKDGSRYGIGNCYDAEAEWFSTAKDNSFYIYCSTNSIDDSGRCPLHFNASGDIGYCTVKVEKGTAKTVQIDSAYIPKAAAVADVTGDAPTAAEFNALLASLRAAGYLST